MSESLPDRWTLAEHFGVNATLTKLVAAVTAGTISLNAAAAVASLPAAEQQTAARGGKEELKQAAKKVREVTRKQAKEGAAKSSAPDSDTMRHLQERVATLTTENQTLRERVAELEAQLH